jgi:hypothetical protein
MPSNGECVLYENHTDPKIGVTVICEVPTADFGCEKDQGCVFEAYSDCDIHGVWKSEKLYVYHDPATGELQVANGPIVRLPTPPSSSSSTSPQTTTPSSIAPVEQTTTSIATALTSAPSSTTKKSGTETMFLLPLAILVFLFAF